MNKKCFEVTFVNNGYTDDWNAVMRYMIQQNADFIISDDTGDKMLVWSDVPIACELIEQLCNADCLAVREIEN